MNGIAMGTTPTINVIIDELDFDKVNKDSFKFYFYQGFEYLIEKEGEDVTVNESEQIVQTYLTQEDTLKFNIGKDLKVELRWLFNEVLPNGEFKAGKTNIISIPVIPTLKKEVIS